MIHNKNSLIDIINNTDVYVRKCYIYKITTNKTSLYYHWGALLLSVLNRYFLETDLFFIYQENLSKDTGIKINILLL